MTANINEIQLVDRALRLAIEELLAHAESGLLGFTLFTKRDYEINWHHKRLCDVLDRFARGEIKRLIVSMPPRHGKSELVSRRLPAFILGKNPNAQIISASYGDDLASRMNRDVQRIIETKEYAALFPKTQLNGKNIRATSQGSALRNSDIFEVVGFRGVYRSAGVGGAITGMGADFAIIDDPIKNQAEADSETFRDKVWEWYTSTLYTRLEKGGAVLLTMTRWHEDDLAGRLINQMNSDPKADQWELFEFPAIRDTLDNQDDPRELGEPLWPNKYGIEILDKIKAQDPQVWDALFQQRPSALAGNLVKDEYIEYYTELPPRFDELVQSWDCAFEKGKSSDFVHGTVWGRFQASYYLLPYEVHERLDIVGTMEAIVTTSDEWPKAVAKLIERKANGHGVIQMLGDKIPGVIPVEPKDSKENRLKAVLPLFRAGNVKFPHPSIWPNVRAFVGELKMFPNGKHDDRVDTTTQVLDYFKNQTVSFSQDMVQHKISSLTGGFRGADRW